MTEVEYMFSTEEIARATGGAIIGSAAGGATGVSTDSRTVQAGQLFVALRGEKFDGHHFLAAAASRGVQVCLAEEARLVDTGVPQGMTVIAVSDSLRGLGDLAAWHRGRFALPVVGVTGSNGKTTTKEMLAAILALTGPGLKTAGNLNNLIGLPLMLFRLTSQERWAVLEMGMSELGEIDRLAEIARPQVGVITNAFPAHLETLGSVEGVARAKGELFLRLPAGGWAIYNADDPLIAAAPSPAGVNRLGFGLHKGDIRALDIRPEGLRGISFELLLPGGTFPVFLRAYGLHNVANAVAAAAAAVSLGVDEETIVAGLGNFLPYDKRFNVEELEGVVLIDDSYNANPASMEAALTTLRSIKGNSRAIAVLGDMLELGPESRSAHHAIGRLAAQCVDRLYLLGEMAGVMAEGALSGGLAAADVMVATGHDEMLADLGSRLGGEEYLLVKGSRGMRMEIIAEGVRRAFPPRHTEGAVT